MESMLKKCLHCRFACKTDQQKECKFEPKNEFLGYARYFKDTQDWKKHEQTSKICVVCKGWFSNQNIKWLREKEGYYSFCLDCAKTQAFIRQTCLREVK